MTRNDSKMFTITAIIIALPVVAFGLTYGLNLIAPLTGSVDIYSAFFMLMMIIVGVGVPFLMLKLMSNAAHIHNPDEKVIEMRDIPKDKQQMDHPASAG